MSTGPGFGRHRPSPAAVAGRKRLGTALALALLVGALWILWWSVTAPAPAPADERGRANDSHPIHAGMPNPFGTPLGAATGSSPVSADVPDLGQTSLAGTSADGDWSVGTDGRLTPSHALRRRFDYYLTLVGEVPLDSLRALVLQQASAELREPALGAVMAMWDRYVALQRTTWKHAVDLRRRDTWADALAERSQGRRAALGAEWAQAFYGEEERELAAMIAGNGNAATAPAATPGAPAPHPQATEREEAVTAQWQQWEQRMATARQQLQTLNADPTLTPAQRAERGDQLLAAQFTDTDLTRARALLLGR